MYVSTWLMKSYMATPKSEKKEKKWRNTDIKRLLRIPVP